jgi:hypothetical protein
MLARPECGDGLQRGGQSWQLAGRAYRVTVLASMWRGMAEIRAVQVSENPVPRHNPCGRSSTRQ